MGYWNTPKNAPVNLDSNTLVSTVGTRNTEFYEIEPAIVLDVILDKNHPYFSDPGSPQHTLNSQQWPTDLDGKVAKDKDADYSWIGRVLVRLYYSHQNVEKEDLIWAIPLESSVSEYPLLNEVVGIITYLGRYYYTRKVNLFNWPNLNADFTIEPSIGGFTPAPNQSLDGNRELILDSSTERLYKAFQGPISYMAPKDNGQYKGVLGRYFYINKNIRTIKRREGDLVFESRFGQSIRFGAYDDNRDNDKGFNSDFAGYQDYKGDGTKYKVDSKINIGDTTTGDQYTAGGGNPMILIRNRQRPLADKGKNIKPYENLPSVTGTDEEKNVGGYLTEDINNDGSSIHITSGVTISQFKTNCSKGVWGVKEEDASFQPDGSTSFTFPKLMGDQIVINSDRMVISAKKSEMFQYAKKRMAFVTDDEFTVDAHNQIVINTNNKTVLNSPAIYLGEYNQTNEPVLLGQTTVNWLYDLCNWLLAHTHWYIHNHPDAQGGTTGIANPDKTQTTVQAQALITLQNTLNKLMSRRVFVVGGGLAPGHDGGSILNGVSPVSIGVVSGTGVPGGFTGANKKASPSPISSGNSSTAANDGSGGSNTSNPTTPELPNISASTESPTALGDGAQKAANEAIAAAAIAKTDKARQAADHAKTAAANTKKFESQANVHYGNQQALESQAAEEKNTAIKAQLLKRAEKEKHAGDDAKSKAQKAANYTKTFDNVALAELAKKQGNK